MKIFILIQTFDNAEDGFDIIGAFRTLEELKKYVETKYPLFYKIENGDYYCKVNDEKIFLETHEEELLGDEELNLK